MPKTNQGHIINNYIATSLGELFWLETLLFISGKLLNDRNVHSVHTDFVYIFSLISNKNRSAVCSGKHFCLPLRIWGSHSRHARLFIFSSTPLELGCVLGTEAPFVMPIDW